MRRALPPSGASPPDPPGDTPLSACVAVWMAWTTRRGTPIFAPLGAGVAGSGAEDGDRAARPETVLRAALDAAAAEVGSRVEAVCVGAAWVAVAVRVGPDVTLRELAWRLRRRSATRLRAECDLVRRVQGAWTRQVRIESAAALATTGHTGTTLTAALTAFGAAHAEAERAAKRQKAAGHALPPGVAPAE